MTEKNQSWENGWGNLCWRKVTPAQIDILIEKGADVNEVEKRTFPFGYEHTTPLLESLRADNPVAFSHLVRKGADLNFRFPYANLYPDGARYSNNSIITEAPNMIYIKYARQKGLEVRAEDFLDVIQHKGILIKEKLSFLADIFESRKNSDESLQVISYFSLLKDKQFSQEHLPKLLENVDFKGSHSKAIEILSKNHVIREHVLDVLGNKTGVPEQATRNQKLLRRLAWVHEKT